MLVGVVDVELLIHYVGIGIIDDLWVWKLLLEKLFGPWTKPVLGGFVVTIYILGIGLVLFCCVLSCVTLVILWCITEVLRGWLVAWEYSLLGHLNLWELPVFLDLGLVQVHITRKPSRNLRLIRDFNCLKVWRDFSFFILHISLVIYLFVVSSSPHNQSQTCSFFNWLVWLSITSRLTYFPSINRWKAACCYLGPNRVLWTCLSTLSLWAFW